VLTFLPAVAVLSVLAPPRHPRLGAAPGGPVRRWRGAPLVLAITATVSVNAVGLGLLIGAARSLGTVQWTVDRYPSSATGTRIAVFPVIGDTLPWLTLVPIGLVVAFLLIEAVTFVVAGWKTAELDRIVEHYAGGRPGDPPRPPHLRAWYHSMVPPLVDARRGHTREAYRWAATIARGRRLAAVNTDVQYLLGAMAVVATVVLTMFQWRVWTFGKPVTFAVDLGVAAAGLVPMAALLLMRWGWRDPQARRLLGVLWDVGTFWPRAFHPFAPPCYAERAVPDLQRRIRWLHDHGERVLLVAHSQGSVLAAAALAADRRRGDPPVALATFGSPLHTLYGWAFPAYVDAGLLSRVDRRTGDYWRNFHYRTDYIGGPLGGRTGGRVDRHLDDPATAWHVVGQPTPPMRRHTGYWSDELMWQQIDALTTALHADRRTTTATPGKV
jgi:hypothetical protein